MVVKPKIWREVFCRDNGRCQYCNADLLCSFSTYWSATVDHVIPRCENGSDDKENLKLACPACNAILSRTKLKTYEERKKYVISRIANQIDGFNEWVTELRK